MQSSWIIVAERSRGQQTLQESRTVWILNFNRKKANHFVCWGPIAIAEHDAPIISANRNEMGFYTLGALLRGYSRTQLHA